MKYSLPFFIGLRYTRAKRRSGFVSFISLASVIGISLGVMVLITVLSVQNGFKKVVTTKFFSVSPQVSIMTDLPLEKADKIVAQVLPEIPAVVAYAPYVIGQGMLTHGGLVAPVQVMGIDPAVEGRVSEIGSKMLSGSLAQLRPKTFQALMGLDLLDKLSASNGDRVMLYTTQTRVTPLGLLPRFRRLHVGGMFQTQSGFGFDSGVVFVHIDDAKKLFPLSSGSESGFHLRLRDAYAAPQVTDLLRSRLSSHFRVSDWTVQVGSLFKALAMQKTIMFIIVLLIVAIAAFNLVVTLVMVVNEKRSDIAIMRTFGASRRLVMGIFMYQGLIVGFFGSFVGVCLGVALSWHITELVGWLQHVLQVQFISSKWYWVDYLPSDLHWSDVIQVSAISWGMSLIATIYPAWTAYRLEPAEALRYDT